MAKVKIVGSIEKGIPIPPRQRPGRKPGGVAAMVRKMDIGDSFVFATKNVPTVAYKAAQTFGFKVTCRRAEEEGGFRVWRIA